VRHASFRTLSDARKRRAATAGSANRKLGEGCSRTTPRSRVDLVQLRPEAMDPNDCAPGNNSKRIPYGAKYPLISRISCVALDAKALTAPAVPAGTKVMALKNGLRALWRFRTASH
jgi:hypothetical protein